MSTADLQLHALRRRRRIGLALLAAAVSAFVGQAFIEWLLPYDMVALTRLHALPGLGSLAPQTLSLAWGLACILALWRLWRAPLAGPRTTLLCVGAGVLLGSARAADGGATGALLLLSVAGVASLGWQPGPQGGLALLGATAASISVWDALFSTHPTLWAVCAAIVCVFAWIERQHLQAGDRRLLAALVERDRLIGQLQASREQLIDLQRQRVQLLAGIAHDLRQPLWALRLYADSLLRQRPPTEQSELLGLQISAVDDASGLLDQFSDLAVIERGALTVRREPVDVRQVLDAVASHLLAGQPRGARLRVYGRGIQLHTDRLHLSRIVQNLAGNALRHAIAKQGDGARVVIGVRPFCGGCAIEVLDNGPGIEQHLLARVFEPYVQLHRGAGSGSEGLGLAIVRGLVASLGMELTVRSCAGRGTRFRVVTSHLQTTVHDDPPPAA